MKTGYWIGLLVIVLLWSACVDLDRDISVDGWNPDLATPLLNGNFTVEEILEGFSAADEVILDPDNQVRVIYESEPFEVGSAELLDLVPEVPFVLFDTVRRYDLNTFNNSRVDLIRTKSGGLFYQVFWVPFDVIDVTLSVPQGLKDGQTFETSFEVNGLANEGTVDLAGWELYPENDTVTFIYEAIRRSSGERIEFPNTFSLRFVDYEFSYVQGYLGKLSYAIPRDTVIIDFFDFFQGGEAFFEDPLVRVDVFNSIGVPVRAGIEVLQAVKPDGSAIPIANVDIEDGIDFNYPELSEIGETKNTELIFDKNNSNIENIIGQPIDLIEYEVLPFANPDEDSTITGFMTDSSSIGFSAQVELPFFGSARGFTVVDTFEIDLSNLTEATYLDFKTITENGFPTDVEMQFYFTNDQGIILDSLITPLDLIIEAATVNADGRVGQKQVKETNFQLEEDRLDALRLDAKKMIVRASITSLNGGNESVRVFSDYDIDYRVGVIAGYDPE